MTKKSSAGLNGGAVAGIVIGVLVGVGAIIFVVHYYRKKTSVEGQVKTAANTFDRMEDDDDDAI